MPTVDFKVSMACGGCAAAVKKVLLNMPGVTGVEVDLDAQKVSVAGDAPAADLLAAVQGAGKAAEMWK
jgi:copper chaperone